jgi:hydrogenase-4 component B
MFDSFTSPDEFYAILLVFAAGAIGSLALSGKDRVANYWGNGLAIAGSALGLVYSCFALLRGGFAAQSFESPFPGLSVSFRIDPLSAFFMLVICLIALFSSIYAVSYVRHYYGKYNLGLLGFLYNSFIASMILVVTTNHAFWFLIVWEIMSLSSYFLVVFEHREPANVRAGTLYFIMAHVGTAFIILSFLLMYSVTGSFDFEAIRSQIGSASPLIKGTIFLCALIGFGTKAGIIPLHIWLPGAHPAAPTHVSALMSGVMIKTGIYMLIRISLNLMSAPPLWWGMTILVAGSVSALMGVLYALAEHDIKRLLAYHSIENIGIILLGLGSALVFSSAGMNTLAALGLVAALYHTLNHATFKALLFMGAGAVISQTHTRNIEHYGGLIKTMPQTALFFLVGSMAISALPPLNGFFSEWLTFQSLFHGLGPFDILQSFPFILATGSLAFTGGLAAACFVKAFGATFLARPRTAEAAHAKESPWMMRLGMACLALCTVVLGVGAGTASRILTEISSNLIPVSENSVYGLTALGSLRTSDGFAEISMPALFIGLVLVCGLVGVLVYVLTQRRKTTIGPTWDCGSPLTPRMEITATGFSRSIIMIFKGVLRPSKQTDTEYHDENLRYFPKSTTVTMTLRDLYQPYIYEPLHELMMKMAERTRQIQSGNINTYILYIFITLICVLVAQVL